MKKIFLDEFASKRDTNADKLINVDLSAETRLLPPDGISKTIDSYNEYLEEKDASNIYRLIFTINPVCTNVLFNANTEIVYKEGSDECKAMKKTSITTNAPYAKFKKGANEKFSRYEAIQDTGFSDETVGGWEYHCGADIFNNHTLRRKEYAPVNKITGNAENFNTIKDYLRDSNGNHIDEKILKIGGNKLPSNATSLHLYRYDSIKTYPQSVNDGLIESDGWVGFLNPSSLSIPNVSVSNSEEWVTINRCMNDRKAGEMVDMYPDRTLYSFLPKYNKYRDRLEKNWDYCITYPKECVYDSPLVQSGSVNGVKCECLTNLGGTIFEMGESDSTEAYIETKKIYFKTQLKNTFMPGNFVNFTIVYSGVKSESYVPIKIDSIGYMGDDSYHIFAVDLMDIYPLFALLGNCLDANKNLKPDIEIRVRKYVNGMDCKYYFRKFGKLRKDDYFNTLNKLAFSENIFSDKIAQIVYGEDIVTEGIKDNLGRPLSELYLTIIKRNAGNEEWYNGKETDGIVEFSHCFGKVTSGIELSEDENNYNIHKLHNIKSYTKLPGFPSPEVLEDNVTIENEEFLGDIVEFSPYTMEETVMEEVYHRFNTVQREIESKEYDGIYYDEIVSDDYDVSDNFKVETKLLFNNDHINLNPEGYYYKPHYQIRIKQFNPVVKQGMHKKMAFSSLKGDNDSFEGITSVNYYLREGDTMYLYSKSTNKKRIGKVTEVSGKNYTHVKFIVDGGVGRGESINDYIIFKENTDKPKSAYEMEDGTGRYLWREPLSDKDLVMGDELYNSVFTNGAHYFHKQINFYLRRQDPFQIYGLNQPNTLDAFTGAAEGKFTDIEDAEYIEEGGNSIC